MHGNKGISLSVHGSSPGLVSGFCLRLFDLFYILDEEMLRRFWVRSIRLSWRCSCGFSFLSCCCFGGSFFGVSLFGGSLFGVYFSCSWALLVDLASLTRALSLSCMRQPPAWQMNANDGSSWNMKQMGGVVCVVCVCGTSEQT